MSSSKSSTTDNPSPQLVATVAERDRRRWQRAATRALTEILARADRAKLAPIEWRLTGSLHVAGYIHSREHGNIEQSVLDVFARWVGLLCLTAAPPEAKSGGGIYLVGRHDCWRPKPDQTGAIVTVTAQTFKL